MSRGLRPKSGSRIKTRSTRSPMCIPPNPAGTMATVRWHVCSPPTPVASAWSAAPNSPAPDATHGHDTAGVPGWLYIAPDRHCRPFRTVVAHKDPAFGASPGGRHQTTTSSAARRHSPRKVCAVDRITTRGKKLRCPRSDISIRQDIEHPVIKAQHCVIRVEQGETWRVFSRGLFNEKQQNLLTDSQGRDRGGDKGLTVHVAHDDRVPGSARLSQGTATNGVVRMTDRPVA